MLVDVVSNFLFSFVQFLLSFLFVSDVAHQHFGLERLDHVLTVVQDAVGPFDLLVAEFFLVLFLQQVDLAAFDLKLLSCYENNLLLHLQVF